MGLGFDQLDHSGDVVDVVGLGLYVRLGVELNDGWGAEAEVAGATAGYSSYLRGALTAALSPVDLLTVALGPFAKYDVSYSSGSFASVGGTLRVDFHLASTRKAWRRSALTIGLAGDLGAIVGSTYTAGAASWGAYLTAGWAWY
jgi:hypothetical protein